MTSCSWWSYLKNCKQCCRWRLGKIRCVIWLERCRSCRCRQMNLKGMGPCCHRKLIISSRNKVLTCRSMLMPSHIHRFRQVSAAALHVVSHWYSAVLMQFLVHHFQVHTSRSTKIFTHLRVTRQRWISVKETEHNPSLVWRPLARRRCSWEGDIKVNHKKTGWESHGQDMYGTG